MPDQVPRPRLVRGLRAGRRAADRGGGAERARRTRRQRRGPDRAARARALGREAPAGRAGGRRRKRGGRAGGRGEGGGREAAPAAQRPSWSRRRPMWGIDRRLVQNFDWTLFGLVFSLVAIGIVNLISSTHSGAGISDEVRRQLALARDRLRRAAGDARDRLPPLRALRRAALRDLAAAARRDAGARARHARQPELALRRALPALRAGQDHAGADARPLLPAQSARGDPPRAGPGPSARDRGAAGGADRVAARHGRRAAHRAGRLDLPRLRADPVARLGGGRAARRRRPSRRSGASRWRPISRAASSTWSIPGGIRSPRATR